MPGFHSRLFTRIISRNREVYILKIVTLAVAFASSVLIILFSLNEFGFDRFHKDASNVFRVLRKNTDEQYSGNRLSAKISQKAFNRIKSYYEDSLIVSRVKIMNKVTVVSPDTKLFYDQKIHAADPEIIDIFSFEIMDGNIRDFRESGEVVAMISSRTAKDYTGAIYTAGKRIKIYTSEDTVDARVVAVFKDFPKNSHEDFDVFVAFDDNAITALNFNPKESGVYGRTQKENPRHYKIYDDESIHTKMTYSLQPLPELYFGPRVLGEDARHGDNYSVIILICIASLILFLSLSSFVNLTTITLPYRSKELAIKKLAGTNQTTLLYGFVKESSTLVGISFFIGLLILISMSGFMRSILNIQILPLILAFDLRLIMIVGLLFALLTMSPVFMTMRFIQATPSRLLSTDTITFPNLKRIIIFLQLGISIFLITASVVIRRQINYSLVKEPGQNHDQIVFLNSPAGITNEGVRNLRSGWKQFNPNILDVMAVSQLPDRVTSKEIGSEFYLLQTDAGFREFFNLDMKEGYWFGPNWGDSIIVTNRSGKERMAENQANVIGVIEDISEAFNQPEKPIKITIGKDYHYNWLCVRVLEVDIRRTVEQLSKNLSFRGEIARVNYLDNNFKSWVDYQDKLNKLSAILAIISGVLSCFAIYGLSVSLVRDKLKEIAVHKLFGARTTHVTYLLVREFVKQMMIALAVFGPIAYILLNELLRTFVFSTKFVWLDPVYPIVYCFLVVTTICTFQALSLNRTDFASALKG
ncbi:MAG TPA: FtsX-like permease family protein [Cyclobacteriaceae bacterium]|nr:FtsX-like permease family protein [Cyclobacteriaceae bacterium]